ncbi:type II toxin-antitoxin system death-on-curing family toxin [Candidiatus Paracoxiella cheracis]|uniref:type II toxin-antitoxin system death-on-curing family toxin n=1 Tax=Candidiatus Paracoxiella cheracis TaxID=3405120 RepID=UPI003BF4BECC
MLKKIKKTLGEQEIITIHDEILAESAGLPGLSKQRPLISALKRIDNHILYGKIEDIFEVAALYGIAIAQGHSFNDGNKRTAMLSMYNFLYLNDIVLEVSDEEIEQMMVDIAEKKVARIELAEWLRTHSFPSKLLDESE